MDFLILIYSFSFAVCCFTIEYNRIRRNGAIRIINIVGCMFGLTYGLIITLIFLFARSYGSSLRTIYYHLDLSNNGLKNLFLWIVLASFGYIILNISYYSRIKIRGQKVSKKEVREEVNYFPVLQATLMLSFFVGIISLFLWSSAYGGVFNAILNANAIRSGIYGGSNSLALFGHLAKSILMSSYICLFLIEKNYHKSINILLGVVSFFASLLFLLSNDGRLTTIFYLITLILLSVHLFEGVTKRGKRILFVAAVIAVCLLINMDNIMYFIRTGDALNTKDNSLIEFFISEFLYIPISGQTVVELCLKEGSPFLILQDVLSGIFAWVPFSLKPADFINIWQYNTSITVSSKFNGTFPCDIITTSLYDCGMLGVAVIPYFWGKVIRFLDKRYECTQSQMYKIVYYLLSLAFVRLINYCMLYDFVLGLFYIFISYIMFEILVRIWIKKKVSI